MLKFFFLLAFYTKSDPDPDKKTDSDPANDPVRIHNTAFQYLLLFTVKSQNTGRCI